MQLINIVNARFALQKLIAQDLPLRKAYELVGLVEKCNRHLAFFSQMRQTLGAEPDKDKLRELEAFEVDDLDDALPIEISNTENLRLSAADLKVLEPFVRFSFEEG